MSYSKQYDQTPDPKKPGEPDAAKVIAKHLSATNYDDLPEGVPEAAKICILDTLGCILAGTGQPDVRRIATLVKDAAGKNSSTILGSGGVRVPAVAAAFSNGAAIHQYDFDDVHDKAPCHPTSTSLVPALAAAEARGGVHGKELICAVALGNDVTVRLSQAILGNIHDYPWFRAPVIGIFGAAAAAAKIYGATEQQHEEALGLALPQASGTWASLQHPGSSVRSIRDGLSFRNGVLAAELAMAGIRGDREVFEGPYGLFNAFHNGKYRRSDLLAELGQRNETLYTSLKPWPSIRHLHTTLTAVMDCLEKGNVQFDDIESVLLKVGKTNLERCRPVPLGSIPGNHIDLLNNMHFAVAAAIRHRGLPLALYRDGNLADDVITNSMPKVKWEYDSGLDVPWTFEDGRVRITTKSGVSLESDCKVARGNPSNPMSREQRHAKFLDCASVAETPLSAAQARKVIDAVENLDRMPDVSALTALM